jgi:hypothetical protein
MRWRCLFSFYDTLVFRQLPILRWRAVSVQMQWASTATQIADEALRATDRWADSVHIH